MKKIIKWIFKIVGVVTAIILVLGLSFLYLSPQFGGKANDEQIQEYQKTGHFADGIFFNNEEIVLNMDYHSITQIVKEMFEPDPNVSPNGNIEVQKIEPNILFNKSDSLVRITWLGHSSFLIELDGKNILLDPMFGKYAAPIGLFGRERYNKEMPIDIESLPQIDAIFISHDHYDHLDYPSIEKLKSKTKQFFVPLGVGNHLREWGIEDENITEMDWWQEDKLDDITIAFTPSRHMSGRGLSDHSATLWGSWVLKGMTKSIYFSGDGGYGKHFKEIGEKYGPFDLGLMECGQYNKFWADIHMMPEQTVKATQDVGAKLIIPIHWGTFSLSTHSWIDPIERVIKEANKFKVPISTPQIGEQVCLGNSTFPNSKWWLDY